MVRAVDLGKKIMRQDPPFAHSLGLHTEKDLVQLGTSALLHDIGKLFIPHHILNKQ